MDDLISRNELLAGIDELVAGIAFTSPYQEELHCLIDGMERVRDRVAEAPALALEDLRPQGRWELADDGDGVVCSECGTDFCILFYATDDFHFCPSCGADMRGGGE